MADGQIQRRDQSRVTMDKRTRNKTPAAARCSLEPLQSSTYP